MLQVRFSPVRQWPTKPTIAREHSRFKAGMADTLDLLERELSCIRAQDISIELYLTLDQIRNDGWPRADARPTQPGVILKYTTRQGQFVWPCDKYRDYRANLRAIALTLEALRAIARYGVATEKGEQYRGWLQLPASPQADELTSLAREIISSGSLSAEPAHVLSSPEALTSAWRAAIAHAHPDITGDTQRAASINAARDRIRELKGWLK